MRILTAFELNGPNIWAQLPATEIWVELDQIDPWPRAGLEALNAQLLELDRTGRRPGARTLPTFATSSFEAVAQAWCDVACELHSVSHLPLNESLVQPLPGSAKNRFRIVLFCEVPGFGKYCFERAGRLLDAIREGTPVDLAAVSHELVERADKTCLGPGTRAIVNAAKARGIPALRLTTGNLIQLGYCKLQRRIWTAETDGTGAIAESIAQDKELTRKLLSMVGVPVPVGRAVESPAECWEAAEELGLPVVVKPRDGNHSRGVSIRLDERSVIEGAYAIAAKEGSGVLVERFISGTHYRVLVVGGRSIAAAGGEADQVQGDGISTIMELIEVANRDPMRGFNSSRPLTTLELDAISIEVLRRQGYTADSVPLAGKSVLLNPAGDLTIDVTDRMHPDVAAQCALAARTIGLDIAGIDLISESISLPLAQIGGAIIEVNASPALGPHLNPREGKPRPVGEAIVGHMFETARETRVPVIGISGFGDRSRVARLLGRILAANGRSPVIADTAGLKVGDRELSRSNSSSSAGQLRALINPFVDCALLELPPSGLLHEGLLADRLAAAVLIGTPEQKDLESCRVNGKALEPALNFSSDDVRRAARLPSEILEDSGILVLDATHPEAATFGGGSQRVVYFAPTEDNSVLLTHVASGGTGCVCSGGFVWLYMDRMQSKIGPLPNNLGANILGANISGANMPRAERDALSQLAAAVAAAAGLGLNLTQLAAGLAAVQLELG